MKTFRLLNLVAFLVALIGLTLHAHSLFGPIGAAGTFAVAFFIGANMLDTNWTPRARCATNDISMTGLTEIMYAARDQVAAEPCGFAQGVMVNSEATGVSTGGTVTSLRTQQPTVETSYTPAMTPPDATDLTTDTESMTLDLVAGTSIPLKGETYLKLANTVGAEAALQQLMAQGIRTIRNQIETKIGIAAKNGASRATGTAGTTPFASNINSLNAVRQILEDNGAPMNDGNLSLIINTLAGTNLRNLSNITKANEAGSDVPLRRGELLNLSGFSIRTSAGVASHTAGAGAGYDLTGAHAIASTTLGLEGGTVNTTGFVAGDVIALDTDTANKYVVKTGLTATSGDLIINHPGLRVAGTTASELTIGASYTGNIAYHKSAIELAMRPPAQPPGGDAGEHTVLYDPVTGLVFDMALYKGYGMNVIKIFVFYGIKVWKPEFVATLLG
jgi:hypothetical protein